MEFWKVLEERRSIREFDTERAVDPELIDRLLEAAILAPTAGDRQPWHFVVTSNPEVKEKIVANALRQTFIASAPVMIVVCGEPERSGARWGQMMADLHTIQDTSAAIENILLAATSMGLAACWVSALREDELRQALNLPENLRPLAIVPIGYAAKRPGARPPRRPIKDVTTFIK
ncbi:MAG: nitroreductase family protein [Chloroflexi bacterium]|nr:nitroreductase family protein [Chloroflexota bacterium]